MTETKVCNKCGVEHLLSYYYKNATKQFGVQGECKDCWREYDANNRMYVSGKRINKDHPLWKAGRYNSWDDVCSPQEIEEKTSFGHVYIVYNTVWKGWYKVGRALDAYDRVKNYQTGSPFRDYEVIYHEYFEDRKSAEKEVHSRLVAHPRLVESLHEWFKIDPSVIREVIQDVKREEINSRYRDEQSTQPHLVLCN